MRRWPRTSARPSSNPTTMKMMNRKMLDSARLP
jgi:hypothetical protein